MIKEYINLWLENKTALEDYFMQTPQSEYSDYKAIFKKIIEIVINPNVKTFQDLDPESITVVDDGDYQGTLIFIIPRNTYQPDVSDYIYTSVYYGSCSGCDTLLSISGYEKDIPNEEQVKEYMTLALHLVENMKWLREEAELDSRPVGAWEEPTGIEKNLANAYGKKLYVYRCSECGFEIWKKTKPNFCERCGADMRGTE